MENKRTGALSVLMGILGVGLIILCTLLFTTKNTGEMLKGLIISLLQADLGSFLLIFGIKKNRSKGKPAGDMYYIIGLAILTTTAFTIYNLYTKLAQ